MSSKQPFTGPFGGIVDDTPRPYKQPGDWDNLLNWFVREGRLQTRPRLVEFGPPPDNATLRNVMLYQDVLNNQHVLALTTQTPYALTSGAVWNELAMPTGLTLSGTSLPYGWSVVNGKVFFSNGSTEVVYADGSASIKATSDVQGAARFMAVLASHLMIANTTEPAPGTMASVRHPQRVRWSASGDPLVWTGASAGFNDLLEVPDDITGLVTQGRNAYVYRRNGITTIAPIGPPNAPFIFDNISVAPLGIGNYYPYSLASFGVWTIFVSQDDIYLFDTQAFIPIGGAVRKKIYADLANSAGDEVSGYIVPSLGVSYPFLTYWLSIPGVNVTWVFSRANGKWTRFSSSAGYLSCLAQGLR